VALRVAAKARARAARRRENGGEIADVPAPVDSTAEWSDVMPIIDAELNRLRTKHRDVLVICLIEGTSTEEAALRLGCPVGTVKSRLARARETLRARLIGRGVALAVLTSSNALASPVPSTLTRATLKTITAKAVPPGLAALITGVAPTMLAKTSLMVIALAGCVGVAGLGVAYWPEPSSAQDRLSPATAEVKTEPQTDDAEAGNQANRNNLKQILVALHAFAIDTDDSSFPPPAIQSPDGLPNLSWRVALLPYLGQNDLYQQFHLDEPWDSPRNIALIDRMPAVFETPGAPAPKGQTRFRGLAGEHTMFEPSPLPETGDGGMAAAMMMGGEPMLDPNPPPERKGRSRDAARRGIRFADITDGLSNTLLLVIARDATIWTKPGELPFIRGQEFPSLDESDPRGIVLGLADGSARYINHDTPQLPLESLATRNGGEIIDQSIFVDAQQPIGQAPTGSPKPTPTAPPTGPAPTPTLEQRLKSVEEKLDRLLRKLDPDHENRP